MDERAREVQRAAGCREDALERREDALEKKEKEVEERKKMIERSDVYERGKKRPRNSSKQLTSENGHSIKEGPRLKNTLGD